MQPLFLTPFTPQPGHSFTIERYQELTLGSHPWVLDLLENPTQTPVTPAGAHPAQTSISREVSCQILADLPSKTQFFNSLSPCSPGAALLGTGKGQTASGKPMPAKFPELSRARITRRKASHSFRTWVWRPISWVIRIEIPQRIIGIQNRAGVRDVCVEGCHPRRENF